MEEMRTLWPTGAGNECFKYLATRLLATDLLSSMLIKPDLWSAPLCFLGSGTKSNALEYVNA